MLHIALPLMLDFFGLLRIKAFARNIPEPASRVPKAGRAVR
jgi:hypothetical protein